MFCSKIVTRVEQQGHYDITMLRIIESADDVLLRLCSAVSGMTHTYS